MNAQITTLSSEITAKQIELENRGQRINELTSSVIELKERYKILQECADADHCIAMRAHNELITARADLESMNHVLKDQGEEIARYKGELEERQRALVELEQKVHNYQKQERKAKSQLAMKDDTTKRQLAQISALKLANEALTRDLQESAGRAKAKKQQQSVQALNAKLATLIANAEADQELIKSLRDELGQAEVARVALVDRYEQLQRVALQTEHDADNLARNNSELDAQITQLLEANQDLSEELNKARNAEIMARDLHRCMSMLAKVQHTESLAQLVNDGRATTKAEDLLMALKHEAQEMAQRLCIYIDNTESLKISNGQLQEDIEKQACVIKELREELQEAQQTCTNLTADIEITTERCEELEAQLLSQEKTSVVTVQPELAEGTKEELQDRNKRIEELTAENQRLKEYQRMTDGHLEVLGHYNPTNKRLSFYTMLARTKEMASYGLKLVDTLQQSGVTLSEDAKATLDNIQQLGETLKMKK